MENEKGFIKSTNLLMHGTPEQQEVAAQELDRWFVEDQGRGYPQWFSDKEGSKGRVPQEGN